jgi:hypothetical protein
MLTIVNLHEQKDSNNNNMLIIKSLCYHFIELKINNVFIAYYDGIIGIPITNSIF